MTTYQQLYGVNLTIVGQPDYCLSYVESVFAAPHLYPTAWTAWNNCHYKHTDTPPAAICVPIWFSWSGRVDGTYDNYGHVAVWVHGQIYTNPPYGAKPGHVVFRSLADIQTHYGVKYVGWSEDIAGKRLVQPVSSPVSPRVQLPQTITLPASNPTWRIYKVTGPYTVGHEVAKLAPAKFGGLTYTIQKVLAPYVYEIKTRDFGLVAIYGGPETGAIIT